MLSQTREKSSNVAQFETQKRLENLEHLPSEVLPEPGATVEAKGIGLLIPALSAITPIQKAHTKYVEASVRAASYLGLAGSVGRKQCAYLMHILKE